MTEFTNELVSTGTTHEWIAFVTGILSVLLLLFTKQPRLQWVAWPAGVVSAAIYMFLFYDWQIYGNMILQPLFVVISIMGLITWRGQLRGIIENVAPIPTTFAPALLWRSALLGAILAIIPVYVLLDHYDDAYPLWDGLILTLSLAAIYLQWKKYVQSWYIWIMVDLIAVPLHWAQNHEATAFLYLFYMIMCFFGLRAWYKEAKGSTPPVSDFDVSLIDKLEPAQWLSKEEGGDDVYGGWR